MAHLEARGALVRVREPVSPVLEITEIHTRLLADKGPAVLFENVEGSTMPVLTNLFGTVERVAWGMNREPHQLQELGETLAFFKQPVPPESFGQALELLPLVKVALSMKPKLVGRAPCQEVVLQGCGHRSRPAADPDLLARRAGAADHLAPGRHQGPVGRARGQVQPRHLSHAGAGPRPHADALAQASRRRPAPPPLGPEPQGPPARRRRASAPTPASPWRPSPPCPTPCPNTSSPVCCAASGSSWSIASTVPIKVPATAEIVIEGHVSLEEFGDEGPYGDHTGYYNAVEPFPVFTISAITMRRDPIYLSTFTGRPPDEPSVLGEALNDVFVPLLRQQFPEIKDFWLPPEGCSYRVAVVSIKKAYPGHARRIMMGVWSFLRQFMYTKFVIVVDDDIDCRKWDDVIWAISTRVDPGRDLMVIEHTPIDYLDFASPESGLGGKLGHRRHRQMAARDQARVGSEDQDGGRSGGEGDGQMEQLWSARGRPADMEVITLRSATGSLVRWTGTAPPSVRRPQRP